MSTIHEQMMCELVELYALDALSQEETQDFRHHLAGCASCQAQLKELQSVVALLPLASAEAEPPSGMRDRVLGNVLGGPGAVKSEPAASPPLPKREERREGEVVNKPQGWRRGTGYWRLVSVGLSAAVIMLSVYSADLRKELERSQEQLALVHKPAEALKVNQIVNLNPTAQEYVSRGLATIVIDDKGTHLIVQAESLPELRKDEAFQVWLIKGDQPVNAGTFYPHNGRGSLYYTFQPNEYDTVAITLEPDAHGQQPRGKAILAAGLKS